MIVANTRFSAFLKNLPLPFLLLLSALVGALLPLAFAPFAIWPLAIILPAILLVLADSRETNKQVFITGFSFGLGYFALGVYWIYNSLHDFGMASPVVAGAITALMIVTLSIFPALTLLSWQSLQRRIGQQSIWLVPILWFTFEWFRGWVLTGMPWLSLGYAFGETSLAGFAPLIGVYGLSAIGILVSVALIQVIQYKAYRFAFIIVIVFAVGFGLQQIEWTEQQPKSLDVTIVQGNIPQEMKWQYDQRRAIFNTYWRETQQYWSSDLIVWPETALPGQSENIRQSMLNPLSKMATEKGSHILTGLLVSDTANRKFHNSMMMLGGNLDTNEAVYHKRHLVLFGEYYPMRWLLDLMSHLINIPYSDLQPGPDEQPLMKVNGFFLGVSICFEDAFSRDIMLSIPQANLLVNASNDAWFGDSLAPHQHLQMAQMRSLETGRAMVRSTNTGVSAFIDFKGRIIQQTEQFKTLSITQTMYSRTGITPFYYFAKVQHWIAGLILIILSISWFYTRREKTVI
jgi:apolipoprotein N-acyltransferase